ncbi:MAG: FAD:protein FMN transferase, partial [Gammaproteobacteria bacterium]|nr:FAD:protein FMN transferase [Gammaproteobacteria bacterium]
MNKPEYDSLYKIDDYWRGRFQAMASPCECLIVCDQEQQAKELLQLAFSEVKRIEQKFSRYRDDNIIYQINHSHSEPVTVDAETADLLDFAGQCYELSDGLFDITSGVLREAWKFDSSDCIPENSAVEKLLEKVGWDKVIWTRPELTMQQGMEIDLGGIGKEYAVDQVAKLLKQSAPEVEVLVNFGGDLVATGPRKNQQPWTIGVDDPAHTGEQTIGGIKLSKGAFATSGDARRYLLKDNIRYSHILNPKTGWPVINAPRSVSVIANTCIEAGMLATFALL